MIKVIAVSVLVMAAGGCASSSETYLPDGRKGHSLDCSGTLRDWGECYEKAGSLCGSSGYDIVAKQGEGGAVISGAANRDNAALHGSSRHYRTMQIACK